MKRRKQKMRKEHQETPKKKKKADFEWRPEDCAQPIGESTKSTGDGEDKKCHYVKFEFRGIKYGLEDTVLLRPEETDKKPYVAIIKDIYVQGTEGYVKLHVQWFYRPEDVRKRYVGKWGSKDLRNLLFYSFHCDDVFAESVKHKCLVYFIPENKQISNRTELADFIVQKVYDGAKKKLESFTDNGFDLLQQLEIDRLVEKTASRVGELPEVEKVRITKISRRKSSVRKGI